ncbi:MAG: adenine nucleotide alpha hydrolase [Gammaproteobacteria bacterium]|nr:adenine nucleotide alpha hydrolase [Gammaproteobacteria bacterium]
MSPITLISWSSGKDSAYMLYKLQQEGYGIEALLTMTRDDKRVSVHGVRRELLQQQAMALNLPLEELLVNETNSYETVLMTSLLKHKDAGISTIAYGDLFLADIKVWREQRHQELGVGCLFPIWEMNTVKLAREIVDLGFKSILTCVNTKHLDASFAGRSFDHDLLDKLPEGVDPCGENGEFHTFVYDGPNFNQAVEFTPSKPTIREFNDPMHKFTFSFCDLK